MDDLSDSVTASDDEDMPMLDGVSAQNRDSGRSEPEDEKDRPAGGIDNSAHVAAAAAVGDREAEAALLAGELSRDAAMLQMQVGDSRAVIAAG